MRKILLLGAALSLFSCSQEDQVKQNSEMNKEISTIDAYIGYASPYEYSPIHGQWSPSISGPISYIMSNNTNLNIKMRPFFSYGSFDENLNNPEYWPQAGGNYNLIDPSSSYYSPNLTANGYKYGNFVEAEPIYLTPSNRLRVMQVYGPVPFQSPEWPDINDTNLFNFNYSGSPVNFTERGFLGKSGKLYFMKFSIEEANGTGIEESIVKLNFPHNIHSDMGALPPNWETVGINDNQFGEEMLYNKLTREICITITDKSVYKDTYTFKYNGQMYEVGIRTTASTVEMYLDYQ
ncbi:MAG: hypothetical protein LBI32_02710 [Myroides odoratus]|jgi:hypothetical protein|nr:hypothetical protein [Myroides odoratus]